MDVHIAETAKTSGTNDTFRRETVPPGEDGGPAGLPGEGAGSREREGLSSRRAALQKSCLFANENLGSIVGQSHRSRSAEGSTGRAAMVPLLGPEDGQPAQSDTGRGHPATQQPFPIGLGCHLGLHMVVVVLTPPSLLFCGPPLLQASTLSNQHLPNVEQSLRSPFFIVPIQRMPVLGRGIFEQGM